VSLDEVRQRAVEVMGLQSYAEVSTAGRGTTVGATVIASSHPATSVDRFDGGGRKALARAYWEAGRANEPEVAPHHLLLGLIATDEIWIRRALTQLGVDLANLTSLIDAAAPPRPGPRSPGLTEAPLLVAAFVRAAAIAAEKNSALIRSEHLLLALASGEGIAATTLGQLGATPKSIREILDRMSG
jgi:ATP-dependent Clp protease ATP-binding subunit ClpB